MKHFEIEEVVRHSPKEVWRLYAKKLQDTLPKAIPQNYTSSEYLDGPPLAAGGIFQMNYNNESKSPSSLLWLCVFIYVYL